MKKYSYIIIMAVLLGFCSCSYEYEMPDYSNAVTCYDKTQLENGIENKIRENYSIYDVEAVNIDIQEEHAIEKDVSGSVIYDGDARGQANIRSKSLELSYAVKHRIRYGGGRYQPVVAYYQRSFDIDVSPFEVKASVTNEKLQIPFYLYSVTKQSFNNTIFDKVDELSYELADTKIYVTELDKEKKDLLRYEHKDPYGKPFQPPVLSQVGAEYIYVEIEVYGWPKDEYRVYYDKRRKIGTFVFNNEFRLFDINNSTLELTSDMQYTFIEEPELSIFYNVKNSLPMVNKANELGFEFSSWKMYITEKDSKGNALTRFEHESVDGMIEAKEGAKSIDVEVEIYGWTKENGRVNYNKKQKIGTFVIKDILISDIKNKTLELTGDMKYTFIEEPELSIFYNVKNSLPMVNKANELAFEFSSWEMYITEKDSEGNALTRFVHKSANGMIEAQEGAKSIDVEVEIYGWPKENGRVNYNKNQKIGTFVIRDIMISDIKNKTLELTGDIQYEFVTQ